MPWALINLCFPGELEAVALETFVDSLLFFCVYPGIEIFLFESIYILL